MIAIFVGGARQQDYDAAFAGGQPHADEAGVR